MIVINIGAFILCIVGVFLAGFFAGKVKKRKKK